MPLINPEKIGIGLLKIFAVEITVLIILVVAIISNGN
jgi:hypothetical protein